jgi:hypothetical protein
MGVDDQCHVLYALQQGKYVVPTVHMAGCASVPIWTGVFRRRENFVAPVYTVSILIILYLHIACPKFGFLVMTAGVVYCL